MEQIVDGWKLKDQFDGCGIGFGGPVHFVEQRESLLLMLRPIKSLAFKRCFMAHSSRPLLGRRAFLRCFARSDQVEHHGNEHAQQGTSERRADQARERMVPRRHAAPNREPCPDRETDDNLLSSESHQAPSWPLSVSAGRSKGGGTKVTSAYNFRGTGLLHSRRHLRLAGKKTRARPSGHRPAPAREQRWSERP
jgi:hypothetical protein